MKIIFAGTPDFAQVILASLLSSHHSVEAVLTQPDRPAGRGRKPRPSSVKTLALEHGIPVSQPERITPDLLSSPCDALIVVAYGLILPDYLLNFPRYGCINVHASLLPRWRGAAPIQRAIAAGDTQTGITIMQMDAGLDTGDMLSHASVPISSQETAQTLHDRLAELGGPLLLETLDKIEQGITLRQPQDASLATYAHKITKEEARIDWSCPAQEICRLIRAFNPWPVCFAQLATENIRIWCAEALENNNSEITKPGNILSVNDSGIYVATGKGIVKITELQWPGARRLPVAEILKSKADWFKPGACFSG